jgi:hypothetical protein
MSDLVLDQLTQGKPVLIEKNGKSICVARVGDEVFAIDDTCTHSDASLGYKPDSVEPISTVALGNTFTASVMLNDSFTGGGIRFSAWDLEVYPKPGSALFYPSNYIGAHEVLEITSGTRWAFLAFFSHGDRTYVSSAANNQYPERYEWTMKFRDSIRTGIGTIESNLNLSQRKVLINEESAKK